MKNIYSDKKRIITFLLVLCYGPSQVWVQISFPMPTVARPPPTVHRGRYSVRGDNNTKLNHLFVDKYASLVD